MSYFAFYDHVSTGGRGPARILLLVPAQRLLRRLLRPTFFRLRDLLQSLFDRQESQASTVAALAARVAALEESQTRLAQAHRALSLDHLAATRRVVFLEDLVLQVSAGKAANCAESPRILPVHRTGEGAIRLAS